MINISALTRNVEYIAEALRGKWDRHAEESVTWVILGQIVFVESKAPVSVADLNRIFPYKVISWHIDGTGAWGILE